MIPNGIKGAFNIYVDKILSNFGPLPSSSVQIWTFYILHIYPLSRDFPVDFLLTHFP